jgi:glyoxylase-like metal-dependent hydrolase (beta-lactamase superfamily II)
MKGRTSTRRLEGLRLPAIAMALLLPAAAGAQAPAAAGNELHVLPVRGNVFMVVGAGSNIALSAGIDGQVLIDAGSAAMAEKVIATVAQIGESVAGAPARLTTCVGPTCYQPGTWGPLTAFGFASPSYTAVIASPRAPKPIRWILQTTLAPDHQGGTPKVAAAGVTYNGGEAGRLVGNTTPATVIGHENILKRMTELKYPEEAWPTETYYIPSHKMSQYINGEGIQMYHVPNAITDGDSIVFFRFSDVIVTGDIFTPGRYPMIEVAKGGSVQGVLDGLNQVIELAFPEFRHQGGTLIIPGHGRLGDVSDVAIYRNMVEVVRDRIQDLIKQGMTLQQVKAAKPTLDFDGIYGSPDPFIEAVYQSLTKK